MTLQCAQGEDSFGKYKDFFFICNITHSLAIWLGKNIEKSVSYFNIIWFIPGEDKQNKSQPSQYP